MILIRQIIEDFLKQNEAERRLSSNSLRGYRQDLMEFLNYLETQGIEETSQLDLPLLRSFLALLHKKNKKSSVARKMAALRSCFGYAQKKGWILENPIAQVRTPKIEKTIPPFLSEKEVDVLLQEPVTDSILELRDQAFLELFYASGIRLSELTHLNWSSLDLSLGLLRVIGKGGKERVVPMGRKAIQSLLNYRQALKQAEQRSEFKITDPQAVFLNRFGERVSDRTIARRLKKKSGQGKSVSGHQPAFLASQLCNPSAECRGRPANCSGTVGTFIPFHNPKIYAYQHEPFTGSISKGPSKGVRCLKEQPFWPCVIRGKSSLPATVR